MIAQRLRRRLWFYGGLTALTCAGCYATTAMPGTSFRGALPAPTPETRDLAGRLERHVRALAVTVEAAGSTPGVPKSALLLGGDWTPPYRFSNQDENRGWSEGDPELLAANVPRHSDGTGVAPSEPSKGASSAGPQAATNARAVDSGFAVEGRSATAARWAGVRSARSNPSPAVFGLAGRAAGRGRWR